MRQALAGDEDAYRELLHDVRHAVIGYLRRRLPMSGDVEDAAQDVLVAVHRARHTYEPARPFDPWLFGIARHVAIDHVRRQATRGRRETLAGEQAVEQAVAGAHSLEHDFAQAWDELSPIQREAVRLVHFDGLSLEEAAARAGTTKGALKVRVHRALAALRRVLGG